MENHLIPKVGEHRLYDLTSEKTSAETKASAARWYAEMMIDLFFSHDAKKNLGETEFNRLALGEKIKLLKKPGTENLVNSLNLIKEFGDKASHYLPGRTIEKKHVTNVINKALELFDFALIDLMKDGGIRKTEFTAKLFSTFLPSIRVRVIKSVLDIGSIDPGSDDDMFLLDKLLLAQVKNGEGKKSLKLLDKLQKESRLPRSHVEFWKMKLRKIQGKMDLGVLPIPENISDCRRNFEDVLAQMSASEKIENSDLIMVFETMLAQIKPSEMGGKVPDLMILM